MPRRTDPDTQDIQPLIGKMLELFLRKVSLDDVSFGGERVANSAELFCGEVVMKKRVFGSDIAALRAGFSHRVFKPIHPCVKVANLF